MSFIKTSKSICSLVTRNFNDINVNVVFQMMENIIEYMCFAECIVNREKKVRTFDFKY